MLSRLRCWILRRLITTEIAHAARACDGPWSRAASLRLDRLLIAREALDRVTDDRA